MTKAVLVIDDIPEGLFTEKLSIKYELIYYPDGHMKELGINGKQLLKEMPQPTELEKFEELDFLEASFELGRNQVIYELLGEENDN